jgi:hypothetical protein
MCCFCNNYEIIQHLFFDCTIGKFIWRIIQLTFELGAPTTVRNIFGAWAQNMNIRSKHLLYIEICVMFWGMWLSWNDNIFNRLPMQVIFRCTHWTWTWALLQTEENQTSLHATCRLVETMTMEVFAKHDWWFSNRLIL